jgi:hypothetical protein
MATRHHASGGAPAASDRSGGTLPDDLLAEHLQRLTAFALVAGGLWGSAC